MAAHYGILRKHYPKLMSGATVYRVRNCVRKGDTYYDRCYPIAAEGTSDPHLAISARISEERAAKVLGASVSLTGFAEFVLSQVPLEEWIERFKSPVADSEPGLPSGIKGHWSKEELIDFLDRLRMKKESFEPLCLLTAMAEIGPEARRDDLRRTAGFDEYPLGHSLWPQEIKAARRRLHTWAKAAGKQPLFLDNATDRGAPLYRMHPQIHEWLNEWLDVMPRDERVPPSRWAGSSRIWSELLLGGTEVEANDGPELVYDARGRATDFSAFRLALEG